MITMVGSKFNISKFRRGNFKCQCAMFYFTCPICVVPYIMVCSTEHTKLEEYRHLAFSHHVLVILRSVEA